MGFNYLGIVESWGIVGHVSPTGELYCLCPLHDNRNTPAMNINLTNGKWVCHAGCGAGNTLWSLGSRVLNLPYSTVFNRFSGWRKEDTAEELIGCLFPREEVEVHEHDEQELQIYQKKYPKWFIDRGFSIEDIERFGVLGSSDSCIILPVHFVGRYRGYIKRLSPSLASEKEYRYWYTPFMEKNELLFGYDILVKQQIGVLKCNKIVLCEGALDCVWLQKAGLPAVAVLGTSISEFQQNFIRTKIQPEEIYLAFDNDAPGRLATQKALKIFKDYRTWVLQYPEGAGDPQEIKDINHFKYQDSWKSELEVLLSVTGRNSEAIRRAS